MHIDMRTHWKKAFNPNFLGAWSIDEGKDLVAKIESTAQEELTNQDGKKEMCLIVNLSGQKPMVCNKTNAKTIAIVCGSPYLEDWPGNSIQLYVEQVRAFGETVPALRVRPIRPTGKKAISPERFIKMQEAVKAGKFDKTRALSEFALTAEQRKKIAAL